MLSHICLKKPADKSRENVYRKVIVCGSPERANFLSTKLNDATALAKNREYHSYLGKFKGENILVMSHGVGSSGAAICFHELMDVGAEVILRLGTAGGLYEGTAPGDIVVAVGAVRKDGVSPLMIPIGYPAVPDLALTTELIANAKKHDPKAKSGVIVSSDLFYPGPLGDDLALFSKAGCVAVEMECATLFVCGRLRNVATAALVVLDGNPLKWNEGHYDPAGNAVSSSIERCASIALQTLADYEPRAGY
jgi:uridine phosphorylase